MKEKFYDEEIAPTLLELGKKCEEAGISIVWVTELDDGSTAEVGYVPEGAPLGMTMLRILASTGLNIDSFFIELAKYFRKNNIDYSGSIVMRKLMDSEG